MTLLIGSSRVGSWLHPCTSRLYLWNLNIFRPSGVGVRRKKTPSILEERALPVRIERDVALNGAGGGVKKKGFLFGTSERLVSAELIACQLFSCPVYEVKLASGTGEKTIFIDGFFGKKVLIAR